MDWLTDQLEQLEEAELVCPIHADDLTYLFKHALTQESAYESLLLKERHAIHRLVADVYQRLYPDRLDENAGLLEQHYLQAGDDEQAFNFAMRAGDAAARIFAYVEASAHYTQALDALDRLPETDAHRLARAETLLRLVEVSLRAQGPVVTLKRLAHAERLARPLAERERAGREDRLRLARVQYWRGQALIHQNEMRAAIKELQQVLKVAQAEGDAQLLAMPASVIGRTLVAQGRFAQALPVLTTAVAALEQVHNDHEWILATGFRGVALAMLGDYQAGVAECERALAHATHSNTLTGMALAHGALGMVYFFGNALTEGIEHARAMTEIASQSGDRLYAYTAEGFMAWALARAGDCAEADEHFAQAHAIAEEIGGQLLFADWFAASRAERALRCGRSEQALTLAATVSLRAHKSASLFAEGLAERIRGQALARLATPRWDGAEIHLATSLGKFEEGNARLEAARTRVELSEVLEMRGQVPAARQQLEQAAAQFERSGLGEEHERARLRLASLPG